MPSLCCVRHFDIVESLSGVIVQMTQAGVQNQNQNLLLSMYHGNMSFVSDKKHSYEHRINDKNESKHEK